MKNIGDVLLQKSSSSEMLMGNYALVRAMIEAGTKVVTSYPGSPTVEIAEAIKMIPKDKRPFYFEFSSNEIVATEVALGASVNGNLSTVFFKSVGLNVAADCFVQLPLMKMPGGMVVVIGDDPGAHSSQNEQDNRHYSKMSYMPTLEPANPNEVYSYYKKAAELSKELMCPVMLRLTTHVCHAKESVKFSSYEGSDIPFKSGFDSEKNGPYIPLSININPLKKRALKNLEMISEKSRKLGINEFYDNNSERGIIVAGMPYLSLMEVVSHTESKVDILKLGLVYPLVEKEIVDFLKNHSEVLILEELDPIIEEKVKTIAFEHKIDVFIKGKEFDDYLGEYTEEKVRGIISRVWPDMVEKPHDKTFEKVHVAHRPPQMCPGCGHRSAFYAVKKALAESEITVADIGCHSLGAFKPYKMGEILVCMGASVNIGSGMSIANKSRNVVSFIGDSTFFHAGLPGVINALYNKHNLTLIVLENGTTAMTGHQNLPSVGMNFDEPTDKIPIRRLLEALGVKDIEEIDTYKQRDLTKLVKDSFKKEGLKVIIAKHPCMLKFTREHKRASTEINHIDVDKELCKNSEECIKDFACPSFLRNENNEIETNKDICIGDGSCIQTCPLNALKRER